MIKIPSDQNKLWRQSNLTDVYNPFSSENLYATYNCDLTENEGRLRLGKRLVLNTTTSDVVEMTSHPAAFAVYNNAKWAISGANGTGYVLSQSSSYPSASTFSKVTGVNTPSTVDSLMSDMLVSNDQLYVTTTSNSVYFFNGAWGTPFAVGTSDTGSTHMLCSYAGRTYMSKLSSLILSWDSANTVATSGLYTLQLGNSTSNQITWMRASSNRIWIGTINLLGGKGYVYEWDGASSIVTKSYRLEAQGALACVIKDDIPYIMDTNGNLLVWNGGTFRKIAGLNRTSNQLLYSTGRGINGRWIHPNGMSIIKGKINILIDGRSSDSTYSSVITIPSGIWEYDENHGLYHKHSIGISTSSGTITDYGQIKIGGSDNGSSGAGALAELNILTFVAGRNGTFLAGFSYFSDATNAMKGAIVYDDSNDTLQKAGYFITAKIESPQVTDNFQKAILKYRKFLNANDKIVLKYRTEDIDPVEADITWTSTTTFTVPNSSVVVSNYWTSGTGNEVEVIQGIGSGKCSHITNAVLTTGTWTVTVDETYTGATGTAKARFTNWIKKGASGGTTFTEFSMGIKSTWVQFKVWGIFTGRDEIEQIQIINSTFKLSA